MDYLKTFREMISLSGLTDHTIKSYSTYISAYLDHLDKPGIDPKEASWDIMRGFIISIQYEDISRSRIRNFPLNGQI